MDGLLVNINDLTVEVRNSNLNRVGVITPKYLDFKAQTVHNGVGQWELTLPASHPMASVLATPGSGIVVSLYGATKFSGPTTQPARSTDRENPDGSYTFTGVTDDVLLADALAYPQPSNSNPVTQTTAYDIRSGNAETVMRDFVSANIGPTAPAGRKTGFRNYIELDPTNLGRGTAIVKSARFDNLGALLGEIATVANLGFQIVQRGSMLRFEVLTITDRSASVRLNVQNGNISRETLVVSPPEVTRVVVAGQGEGVARQFVERTTTDSTAAEAAWGRRIEVFKDQRNTDNTTELQQAGDKLLLDAGFTATAVKAIPADAINMMYGKDWEIGDTVGLVTFGQETKAVVTAAVILVNKETVSVGASIGDVTGFDASNAQAKRVEDTARRVDALEKSTPKNAFGIVDLSDVAVASPTGGQVLAYNSTTSKWANSTLNMTTTLAALTDVAVSTPSNGQLLAYNSTTGKWGNTTQTIPENLPAGSIMAWATSTPPGNWLICDGSAVSRSTYASLFAAIGTTYGAGNGTTTFNLPDLRGRVPVGKNTGTFSTLGATGGVETHRHNFGFALGDKNWSPGGQNAGMEAPGANGSGAYKYSTGTWQGGTSNGTYNTYVNTNVNAGSYTYQTVGRYQSFGDTDLGSSLQPYQVVNYIIKYSNGDTAGDSQLTTRVSALEVADATTNKSGLVPIVPTSVAVGSGSASVSAAGVVTMTSATTVSLNNCFPSGYRYFRIVINASSSAGDVYMHARLRGSGADNTASSYYSAGFIGYQTAGTGTWAAPGYPQWYLNLMNGPGTGPQLMTMDIMTPNEAAFTNVTGQARYASSTVGMGSITNAFTHYVYTAYDGITFFPASGNITGEIRVYGYR